MEAEILDLRASSPEEISQVRHVVEAQLQEWGLGPGDVVLVLSELVTNAVKHAGGADRILLHRGEGMITLAVHDPSPSAPVMRSHGDGSGGFGLRIVDEIATAWGWQPSQDGKRVWADIRC